MNWFEMPKASRYLIDPTRVRFVKKPYVNQSGQAVPSRTLPLMPLASGDLGRAITFDDGSKRVVTKAALLKIIKKELDNETAHRRAAG